MQISVVLATCDGQRYLSGQLESLLGQTRLPDELVVVDDASTDDSLALLDQFAAVAPFPVRIERHDERRGSTQTFQRGIAASSGDLVALCDQDDWWRPAKLERLARALDEQPDALFAFSDASLIDESGSLLAERMWSARSFGPKEQARLRSDPFGVLVHRSLVPGCTMMFRARAASLILPIPHEPDADEPLIHDRWLSLVLSAAGPVVAVDEPLVDYRIHPAQQVGLPASAPGTALRRAQGIWRGRGAIPAPRFHHLEHLKELRRRVDASGMVGPTTAGHVDAVVAHLTFRKAQGETRRRRRVVPVARELAGGGYHRYSNGFSSVMADMFAT